MIDNKDKIVNLNLHNQTDRVLDFSDFQKQTIHFDIDKPVSYTHLRAHET